MVDQVKVIEIGSDAIEKVLNDAPFVGLAYPPKLMHAVVAALGRHGYIIEDRYENTGTDNAESPLVSSVVTTPVAEEEDPDLTERVQVLGKTAADWEVAGDDA